MVPFPLLAAGAWVLPPDAAALSARAAVLWGAAIVLFLSGVRRGLSFRTEGGPRWTQLATFALLFGLGLAALVAPAPWPVALLVLAFGAAWILDPLAARAGEAPLYFGRLRPWQMAVPVLALAAVGLA